MRIKTPLMAAAALALAFAAAASVGTASAQPAYGPDGSAITGYVPGPPSGAIDFPESGAYVGGYGPIYRSYGYARRPDYGYGDEPGYRYRRW